VTPEQAQEIARNLYAGHPAAAALMLEAVHGATEERRQRSALALRVLDPKEMLPFIETGDGPAWQAALGVAYLLVATVSATRSDGQRVAGMLAALTGEAARIRARERAA